MVQYGRPSRSSWTESIRSSFGRTIMGKAIWENLIAARLGKGFQLGLPVRTPSKRVILICVSGWLKIGWKETKHQSDVEITQHRSRVGRTNIFPWTCIFGMYSKTMWNKQRYCGQLQNHVWIANFSGWKRRASILWESEYLFVVLWYGGSRKEMCGAILWVTKQDDSTTLQNINSMHWWPSLQRTIEIRGRIVKSMLSNCSENAYTWHELEDQIFFGQWINLHGRLQNGPELVTNAWIVWFLAHITQVNLSNIVKWEALLNNVDWDCFRTLTLLEILKTQKIDPKVEAWAYLGSHTFVSTSQTGKKQTSVSHS